MNLFGWMFANAVNGLIFLKPNVPQISHALLPWRTQLCHTTCAAPGIRNLGFPMTFAESSAERAMVRGR